MIQSAFVQQKVRTPFYIRHKKTLDMFFIFFIISKDFRAMVKLCGEFSYLLI